MLICDKFIMLPFMRNSYSPNAIIFKYDQECNRTKVDISPFVCKNTCIWEKWERMILRKRIQACDKLFYACKCWGCFLPFLDSGYYHLPNFCTDLVLLKLLLWQEIHTDTHTHIYINIHRTERSSPLWKMFSLNWSLVISFFPKWKMTVICTWY